MDEFLKQTPISFGPPAKRQKTDKQEDPEMSWYEEENQWEEDKEADTEPPSPVDESSVAAGSASSNTNPATCIPGVDKPYEDGSWASRPTLRLKGHGKGSRPRGGGARSQWFSLWHKLQKQGMTWEEFVKANPEPPKPAQKANPEPQKPASSQK